MPKGHTPLPPRGVRPLLALLHGLLAQPCPSSPSPRRTHQPCRPLSRCEWQLALGLGLGAGAAGRCMTAAVRPAPPRSQIADLLAHNHDPTIGDRIVAADKDQNGRLTAEVRPRRNSCPRLHQQASWPPWLRRRHACGAACQAAAALPGAAAAEPPALQPRSLLPCAGAAGLSLACSSRPRHLPCLRPGPPTPAGAAAGVFHGGPGAGQGAAPVEVGGGPGVPPAAGAGRQRGPGERLHERRRNACCPQTPACLPAPPACPRACPPTQPA